MSDVPAYSSFIPFCTSSIVLRPGDTKSGSASTFGSKWKPPEGGPFEVDAELRVGFGGFEEAYISRVKGVPYERVEASATEAPLFKSLSTTCESYAAFTCRPHYRPLVATAMSVGRLNGVDQYRVIFSSVQLVAASVCWHPVLNGRYFSFDTARTGGDRLQFRGQ